MNITIITDVLPYPLKSGGAQAQFNMIDVLRKEHNISIIFAESGRNKIQAMHTLERLWPEVKFFPFRYVRQMLFPLFIKDKAIRAFKLKFMCENTRFKVERILKPYGVYFSRDFKRFINNVVCRIKADIVQVEFFPYLDVVDCLPRTVKRIFIHHEIRFVRNRRLLADIDMTEREQQQEEEVKEQEIRKLNSYDAVVALTETDKEILRKNGVDVPVYASPAAVNTVRLPYKDWNGNVVFVGGYGHYPNKEGLDWFLNEVMPLMKFKMPLLVVGSGWPSHYEHENNNIRMLGFVERLEDVVHGSIMIVPILSGSGMRMKILDAAAMNVPFITTSVGVEGLNFKDGKSCLVADTPQDFALALERLLKDETLRRTLAGNASVVFDEIYSKSALAKIRNSIYYFNNVCHNLQ